MVVWAWLRACPVLVEKKQSTRDVTIQNMLLKCRRICLQNYRGHGIKENILLEKIALDLFKITEINGDAYFLTHNSHSRSFLHATLTLIVAAVESGEQNSHMNDMNTCLTLEYMLVWNSVWPHAWKFPSAKRKTFKRKAWLHIWEMFAFPQIWGNENGQKTSFILWQNEVSLSRVNMFWILCFLFGGLQEVNQ
jgi:hypothetical protein